MLERIGTAEIVACMEAVHLESYRRNLKRDFDWTLESARECLKRSGPDTIAYRLAAFRVGVTHQKINAVKAEIRKLRYLEKRAG